MTAAGALVDPAASSVLSRQAHRPTPNVARGEGRWLELSSGERILDACSGGAMTVCLGYGASSVIDAAAQQGSALAYIYNHHFTNEAQERLAARLLDEVAPSMARVRFVSGGSEANATALRLARSYHVERGDSQRWRVIAPAQSYHGALIETLALSGRSAVRHPYEPYLSEHLHIEPSTWRFDPTGQAALEQLDARLAEAGPETVAAYFCEPISGVTLPGYSPPEAFWRGLEERRAQHGFVICCDEVITGMGRTGTWLASDQLPIEPDIVTLGKGLGGGYAPLGAMLCRQPLYDAIDHGSRNFEHGHTWDGAPLPCAVGLAVLDALQADGLVEAVRERGPVLRAQIEDAVGELAIVGEVRGRGFLLGIELVDPRDGTSILPATLGVAELVERETLAHGLLVVANAAGAEGWAGDQILLAPAFTSTDDELALIAQRLRTALEAVQVAIERALGEEGRRA